MESNVMTPFGPAVPSVPLSDSPLSFVVAQVRFPMVTSISSGEFIGPFQERIRGIYSELKREQDANVVVGPDGIKLEKSRHVWRFADDESGWQVSLEPEFLALATKAYTSRADFVDRLGFLLDALNSWLRPPKVQRLGVRYIDRIAEEHLGSIAKMVRPVVLGPVTEESEPTGVILEHSLAEYQYQFSDESNLRVRWGFIPPGATFDPAIEPIDTRSWVLDLDAWHGERPFELTDIREQVQTLADRTYRYFRWATTASFLTTFGASL